MTDAAVRIRGLTAGYRRRPALRDLTWDIGPGRVGLLGPNGAGKTTLISCIVGVKRADSGSVAVGQQQRSIGYVPQHASMPGSMTVRQVIEYHAWLKGVRSARIADAAAETIDRMDLSELADRRTRTLSGGQRQRTAIAAALAHSPSVLVLDEPTVGLDPAHRLAVRRAIKALDSVETIILSTHLVEDVQHLCSRIGVLNHGRLQFDGSVEAFLARAAGVSGEDGDGSPFELAYAQLVDEG